MAWGAETSSYIMRLKFLINLLSSFNLNSVEPITTPHEFLAKADSGCSAHFVKDEHIHVIHDVKKLTNGTNRCLTR